MIAEFFSSLFPSPTATLENPSFSLNDPAAYDELGGAVAESGLRVSARVSLTLAPVWQSVSIISGDVATSTMDVFKRNGDDREIALDHPVDRLISEQPNDEMSAFDLWRRFMIHALLWQNGYLFIDRHGGTVGRPVGLYNLLPDRTYPKRDANGALYYVTEVDGRLQPLAKEQVVHVRGLSIDVGIGHELVSAARNSWGLALAAEGFESKFFANGSQSGGVIEVPMGTSGEAAEKLAKSISQKYTKKENWFKVMVLRDGAKFHATTIDAQKAQLTDLLEHQVRDTARFFNLPPAKLGLKDSVSYNSSEQSQIQYITGCLTHWFSAIRGELQLKLLTEQERRGQSHFIDFNASKLIERDLKTQTEILAIERQNEIINAEEWRRKMNMSPRTDAAAKEYVNPNIKSGTAPVEPPKPPETKPAKNLSPAARAVCADAISRMARRVCSDVRNSSKKQSKLLDWVDSTGASDRAAFRDFVLPSARLAADMTDVDAEKLFHSWESLFFDGICTRLDSLTKPPYLNSDFERNVDEQCRQFEATVCSELLGTLTGDSDAKAE